jgi:carbonic anhydrase/acetyltransferase-like protein (isoleucine patch superfamily)
MFRWNPQGDYPEIDESAYIDKTAVIVGRVKIGKNVFIGPGAVILADESKSLTFSSNRKSKHSQTQIHL